MKTFLVCALVFLAGCAIVSRPEKTTLSTKKLIKDDWYYCSKDSLWSYSYALNGECLSVRCMDFSKVHRLKVTNITGIRYFDSEHYCTETDSLIDGVTRIRSVSDLRLLAVPLDSFPNLQVLDLSDNLFFRFPAEIGQLQNLQYLNLTSLCEHDYCEPCLYWDYRYAVYADGKSWGDEVDTAYQDRFYRTRVSETMHGMTHLQYVSTGGAYHYHPKDVAFFDSINAKRLSEK